MSRRRGEFQHRTSLFEGAYRAWSHLGSLDPKDIFHKSAAELDPLDAVEISEAPPKSKKDGKDVASITNVDSVADEATTTNPNKRVWRYEPLPRSGLEHPYVRSILNPWLGPDADDPDEVEQGLATLRNWWQHRRKGESRSAISALGNDHMRGVVDGYTRHFFTLALDLVKRDKAHPPKNLLTKMGGPKSEKNRKTKPKQRKKDHSEAEEEVGGILTSLASFRRRENTLEATKSRSALEGQERLSCLDVSSAPSALRDRSLALLAGLGSTTGLPLDHSAATLELLLHQQRLSTLDSLELAQLARHRQLLAATSVLTPLEQLQLEQRQRQLAFLSSAYPLSSSLSAAFPTSSAGLANYVPPSWLLEPFTRQSRMPSSEEK